MHSRYGLSFKICKTLTFIFLHFTFVEPSFAVVTNLPNDNSNSQCKARLSNLPIKRDLKQDGREQYFCVGNVIDSNRIVTAAHCLNQVFNVKEFDIKKINKKISTNIAFGNQFASESFEINNKLSGIYIPSDMDEAEERREYLRSGLIGKVKSDFAIIEFVKPFPIEFAKNCPTLPSVAECKAFAEYLNDPSKDLKMTSGVFYRSRFVEIGQGASAKELAYPSNILLKAAHPSSIQLSTQHGYLAITVFDASIKHSFVVGDSGSGLNWINQNRQFLIGIQSAASTDGGTQALFANICSDSVFLK